MEDAPKDTVLDAPRSKLAMKSTRPRRPSLKTAILWAITILTALLFIMASVPKIGGVAFWEMQFEEWGFPEWFQMTVGIVEFVAAIFLIIPRTAFYSAIVLAALMVGAIATHLAVGVALYAIVPAAMLGLLAYIGWMRRPETWDEDTTYTYEQTASEPR